MSTTIKMPATVRELGDFAAEMGVTATEYLEMLGPLRPAQTAEAVSAAAVG